jgi:predicted heme/steroid binding protein
MANDIIDITVTDNSDNVQINATPNLVTINVSNTSGNIVGSNYYLVSSYAALPVVGDSTTLYITNDTSLMYRWNGSAYIQVNSVTSWGTITGTLSNQTDLQTALNLKAPLASPTFTGTVSGITKSMVGLSNVDNTSDVNKPISSATQTALDTKAPLASPTFTGTVSGITKSMVGLGNVDNTTDLNKPISTATQTALNDKEPTITAGTSNQYYRGDKTFQSLVTTAVAEGTNLYFTNARSRSSISLTTTGTSGAATYDNITGILNVPAYLGGVTSFNTRTGAITLTSGDVTTALGFTPVTDARTITINGTTYDLTANRSWTIASGVTSFNTRTGAITPTAGDYTTALVTEDTNLYYTNTRSRNAISLTTTGTSGSATYDNTTGILNIPAYQGGVTSFNTRTGAITLSSSDVTTALGYTPYNATNPNGYTSNVGTVTSVGGTGTVSGLSLSGSVTTSGNLTLGGTLSLTSGNVTSALGYTPENIANKGVANGYASLDSGGLVPASQLPSYVDDVLEYANLAGFPASGETGKIYVALDTNKIYRWSGATYIEVSATVGTIWGGITGTLSNQTDLQNALNTKQNNLSGTGFVKSTAGTISYDTATYYPYPTGTTTQYVAGDGSLIAFPVAGQAGTLVRLIRNQTGATLTKGTVIYISGATGNNPVVSKAIATGDATSAQTFGLCQANIANNATGYVVVMGDLIGLDTSAFTEGQQLYLSSTTAGEYTTTKQYAPAHLVYVGVVTRSHVSLGQIEVRIQNGYEMDELHNVSAQSPTNNDGLFYNTTTSLWEKKSIATVLGYTPANAARSLTINGTAYDLTADRSWSVGTVTSVAALTLGTTGSDVSSSVATGTTTPVITLNIPTASATNRGALSSTDWTTFNSKQNALSGTGFVKISGTTISYDNSTYYLASNPDGYTTNVGTVTSVALSVPTGLSITGSPITTSGTLALTYAAGYSIPTDAIQSNWTTAYTNRITSLTTTGSSGASTLVSNVLNIPTYTLTGLGGVPTSRSLTINGTAYDLSADRSWTLTADPNSRNLQDFTATAGQTTFTVTGGYVVGLLDVYVNGSKLTSSEFTATNGTTFVLTIASTVNDQVQSINYKASVNGVSGAGTTNYHAKFTATGTIGDSLIFDNGTNLGIGTTTLSASSNYRALNINGTTGSEIYLKGSNVDYGYIYANSSVVAIATQTAIPLTFQTNATERMRITSAGTLMVGASSNNTSSDISTFAQLIASRGTITYPLTLSTAGTGVANDQIRMTFNYGTGFSATAYMGSLLENVSTAATSLVFGTYGAGLFERMRITSTGNVGIGSTTAGAQLTLAQNNANTGAQTYLTFRNTATGYGSWAIWKSGGNDLGFYYGVDSDTPSAGYNMKLQYNGTTEFQNRVLIGMSSAVSFRSDSQLQVNNCTILRSNDGYNGNPSAVIYSGNDQSGTMFVEFTSSGFSRIGSITRTGGSSIAYNTTSDIRLKKNINNALSSINKINSIQVRSFDWVSDNVHQDFGFIAQELINVAPEAVTKGIKEEDVWQIDNSKLVPVLVKAIQELSAKVTLLENK